MRTTTLLQASLLCAPLFRTFSQKMHRFLLISHLSTETFSGHITQYHIYLLYTHLYWLTNHTHLIKIVSSTKPDLFCSTVLSSSTYKCQPVPKLDVVVAWLVILALERPKQEGGELKLAMGYTFNKQQPGLAHASKIRTLQRG